LACARTCRAVATRFRGNLSNAWHQYLGQLARGNDWVGRRNVRAWPSRSLVTTDLSRSAYAVATISCAASWLGARPLAMRLAALMMDPNDVANSRRVPVDIQVAEPPREALPSCGS